MIFPDFLPFSFLPRFTLPNVSPLHALASSLLELEPYKLVSYGEALRDAKRTLKGALDRANVPPDVQHLYMVLAMIETTTLSPEQRDKSKDGTVKENVSLWNLSVDMVRTLGYQNDPRALNDVAATHEAAVILLKAFHMWGYRRTINFIRGGRTAFEDNVSFGAARFRKAVWTGLHVMHRDPSLMWDDRRIEMKIPHV
jgi:hypothetical protein